MAHIVTHSVYLIPECLILHPGVSFAGALTLALESGNQLGKVGCKETHKNTSNSGNVSFCISESILVNSI